MNIAITPMLQHLIDRVYPGMTPRQQANQIRALIHDVLLDQIPGPVDPELPVLPFPVEDPKDSANRIADMAPAIDDQNWSAIRRGITKAREMGVWDNPTEMRLIARLNDEFEGAINEHRVQKSRITAFFDRLL